MRRVALLFLLAAACGNSPVPQNPTPPTGSDVQLAPPPTDSDARLKWAIDGPHRSPRNRARDVYRHPFETLKFFGIKKNMTVVELWPGGGWYTEILAPFLRDEGELRVTNYDPAKAQGESKTYATEFEAKLRAAPSLYGKVELMHIDPPSSIGLGPDGSADMVLTFRNVHNWVQGGYDKQVFEAAYKVLKPGGVLGVVEHRADPGPDPKGSGNPNVPPVEPGYVPEATVMALAESVGFKLAGKSDVNANPKDDHKHEGGVWALPPVFRNGAKDHDKYAAIGESDRMTFKFVK
jgi:predicted methyltransferase